MTLAWPKIERSVPQPKFELTYVECGSAGIEYVEYKLNGSARWASPTVTEEEHDLTDFERINVALVMCPQLKDVIEAAYRHITQPGAVTVNKDGTHTSLKTMTPAEFNKLAADLRAILNHVRV